MDIGSDGVIGAYSQKRFDGQGWLEVSRADEEDGAIDRCVNLCRNVFMI